MFGMTNKDDAKLLEVLIGKVCSYQCLYNPANISYKNKRHKNLCWIKIALECNLDATVAKSKWKSLRDRYVRERKSEKMAEERGTLTPRKEWTLYKHLMFLDPFLSTLEVGSEVKRELEDSRSGEDGGHFLDMHSYSKPVAREERPPGPRPVAPKPQQSLLLQPPTQPYVYILPAPAGPAPGPPAGPKEAGAAKRARLAAAAGDKMAPSLEKRFMKYVNQRGLEEAEEYSSDEMFVLSLVPCFNKLTEARKDRLKLDMHKLVYDAVYGSK